MDAQNTFFNPETFTEFLEYLNHERAYIPKELLHNFDTHLGAIKMSYLNKNNYVFFDICNIYDVIACAERLTHEFPQHTKKISNKLEFKRID